MAEMVSDDFESTIRRMLLLERQCHALRGQCRALVDLIEELISKLDGQDDEALDAAIAHWRRSRRKILDGIAALETAEVSTT